MVLEREEQHAERAALKLPPWAWGKPRLTALLLSWIRGVQSLEDCAWDVMAQSDVRTATGVHLDRFRHLTGVARGSFDDDDYRTVLLARALANRSSGTGPELSRVLVALMGDANSFAFVWVEGAVIEVTILDPVDENAVRMLEAVLPYARAAGINLQVLYSDVSDLMLWGDAWGEGWGSTRLM